MTGNILDRVGLAIEEAWNLSQALPPIELTPEERRILGRAAVAAMLEPTEEMLVGILRTTRHQGAPDTAGSAAYRAGIRAALSQSGKETA